ncbi:hypothetical protein OU995_21250 [Roseateles sp. SL47]|uniref:phage adaptor protein n=1 Tax=Roseateles sp. SL47 TaxID=2995138 RepID=UPI00226E9109|nr:hypothetical protein [Roseateles sp. SL47]WAC72073.1 hypothetical protein OU995_21250 [Roseateles sp. SL47]
MILFDDLLPDLLVDVDGCPELTAISHLRRAARAFCEQTHVWTVTLDPFQTQTGVAGYVLALPDGASVVRISQADVGDDRKVDLLDVEDARSAQSTGRQRPYVWFHAGQFFIGPVPTRAVPVTLQLSLKPSTAAEGLPDWIAEDHAETLREGAKQTLFAMAKKDWTDLTAAQVAAERFGAACNAAAFNKTKGQAKIRRRRPTMY